MDRSKISQLIAHHSKDCAKIGYGKCMTARCLKRGGFRYGEGPTDYAIATCEALETVEILQDLRAICKKAES